MRACKHCGLSIGDRATFCPVCGALADPDEALPATAVESTPPARKLSATPTEPLTLTATEFEAEARALEKSDALRAIAFYRQAVLACLETDEGPLMSESTRRMVQRLFDRLSIVLKREGLIEDALEEIDAAAYLGLVDDENCGTKARREALVKRRGALRRAVAKASSRPG
jgi:hypothetical protein